MVQMFTRTLANVEMLQLVFLRHLAQSCRFPYSLHRVLICDINAPGFTYEAAMSWAPVTVAPTTFETSGMPVRQPSLVLEKLGE